jgi:MFS family permease
MSAGATGQTSGLQSAGAGIKPLEGHRLALTLLVLAYTLSIADRMILSILFPDIKAEFGLSDSQLGLLSGLSFALFYATLGLPIARLADRYSRKVIIVTCLAIFSLMTALSGWAVAIISLLIFRIGVGIGEAGVNPASQSIIADYFPPQRQAFAMAILMLGASFGMMLDFAGGGVIAEQYGWRAALMSVGFPELILAGLMIWLLREPPRGGMDLGGEALKPSEPSPPIYQSALYMWRNAAMRHLIIGSTIIGMLSYGIAQSFPSFFIRGFDMTQSEVGIMMALFFGILGAIGALVSGKLSDRLSKKGFQYAPWLVAGAMMLSGPFWIAGFMADDLKIALLLFIIPAFTSNFYLPPTMALIQTLSPVPMRAVASATKMFCLNLIGMGLGPLIVGLLSDALTPAFGDSALNVALASYIIVGAWGALHFWLAGKELEKQQAASLELKPENS